MPLATSMPWYTRTESIFRSYEPKMSQILKLLTWAALRNSCRLEKCADTRLWRIAVAYR